MAASIITPKFRLSLDSISSTTVLEKSTTGAFGITTMPNVYSEAFKAWKDAHAPFKTAIAVYSDAYLAFHAICSSPLVENTTQPMLEGVLAALDSEILGLASDIKQVTSANKTVRLLRNKSTTLVRISILPAELLTRVFELFCYSPEKLGEMNRLARLPWTLACVNTYWRQLTVNNSYLWARLNLVAGRRPDEQARTQLTYARNLPLDVMLDTVKERATFMFSRAPEDLLIEVAPRLRSLTYHADRMTSYSPSDILSHWIRHGTPGTGHRLNLLSYQLLEPDDVRFEIQSNPMSMERIEAFFAPVQYLALHHLYVGWSSALYHGLIELDLNFSSSFIQFPTATEFAAILSASPGLRALKLHGFGLNAQDEQHAVEPIRLDYLQVLFLGEIHRRSLNRLLAMIQPGSIPLYMRFDLQKQSADIVHYVQLLQRSSIMKLMIVGNYCHPPRKLLASLVGVQYLCLCKFVLDISFWVSMHESSIWFADEKYPSVWSSLRTLHLFECTLHTPESQHDHNKPIPYSFMLWIWGGDLFDEGDSLRIRGDSSRAQKVLGSFSRYVPGMQEVQDDQSILLEAWGSALDFAPYSVI